MRRRFINNIWGDIIYYTSVDGKIIVPYVDVFGDEIISNTYNNGVGKIKFKGKITSITSALFHSSDTLETITIPNNVTTIGGGAFRYCSSLTSINIPNSVTEIGYRAFSNCTSLTSITIPNSVTSIGDWAFYNCGSLTSVYCNKTTPPILLGTSVFDANASGRKIYVPYQSLNAYKTAEYWSEYAAAIVGYDFENDTIV